LYLPPRLAGGALQPKQTKAFGQVFGNTPRAKRQRRLSGARPISTDCMQGRTCR
jgi:hypothetical protein